MRRPFQYINQGLQPLEHSHEDPGMFYIFEVGKIEDARVVFAFFNRFSDFFLEEDISYLMLRVIYCDLWGGNENAVLAL